MYFIIKLYSYFIMTQKPIHAIAVFMGDSKIKGYVKFVENFKKERKV